MDEADVIIAGGGPVGMGLAIELGQRGTRVILVERHPEPQLVPKGQNLTQRTMEHIHCWGAEAELRAARTVPADHGVGGIVAYRTLMGGYHYDWLQRSLVRPYYFTDNERLPQYATERVLRERVAKIDTIDVRYGWTVGEIEAEPEGVTVEIVARDGGAAKRLHAHYLVGCDGSHSHVRDRAGISQTMSDHDRLMALLVFHSQELNRLLAKFENKSFYSVLHPDLRGYWRFFGRVDMDGQWFFHAPVPAEARDRDFDFQGLLEEAVGAPIDIELTYVGFWDLRFAIADTYRKGRVFIAGDAAHSHPPYGGYGINTGFEDARNLGWKLAAVLDGWAAPDLLDSYHTERHGVFASTAREFIEKAIETDRLFLDSHDPQRDRDAFENAWARRAETAVAEVDVFEPNYEGSPIVCGDPDAGCTAVGRHRFEARAGHHLAPATLHSGEAVADRLGHWFTLLALDAREQDVLTFEEAAADLGIPLCVIRDEAADAHAVYRARLVLVRPDHFIAWSGSELVKPSGARTILARAAVPRRCAIVG